MSMRKLKKKIYKVLLMIPVLLLFSPLHVCAADEAAAGEDAPSAASTEAVTEISTEHITEEQKATPGDAWYSSITGLKDDQPKTLDDVYQLEYWILLVLLVYVMSRTFLFIFNNLG